MLLFDVLCISHSLVLTTEAICLIAVKYNCTSYALTRSKSSKQSGTTCHIGPTNVVNNVSLEKKKLATNHNLVTHRYYTENTKQNVEQRTACIILYQQYTAFYVQYILHDHF